MSERISSTKILVLFLAFIVFLITVCGIVASFFFGVVHVENPGLINVASFLGFVILCIFASYSNTRYFFLLPFVILAYPAAANDFFPSVFLGKDFELGASLFPFFTHIDIYLLVGIIRKLVIQRGKLQLHPNGLTLTVMVLFLLSSLVNILSTRDPQLFSLLIAGLFPLRYIFLLLALVSNYEVELYEKQLVNGLIFSIFFLLLESSINTFVNNRTEELSSGTLATNTFANISIAVIIFIIYLRRQKYPINLPMFCLLLAAGSVIIIWTETRMALLAGMVSFFLIQFFLFKWHKTFFVFLTLGVFIVVMYNVIDVPDRYSVKLLLSKIRFNGLSSNLYEMVSIDLSRETSSIYSRLRLYQAALNMLFENPFWGTGYGTFNYLKNQFGFKEFVLIDAHNGYLNTLAQMGISSLFFLYFIYIYPIMNFKSIKSSGYLKYVFVINFTMSIADFSNAGIYKPPVFALLAFSSFIIMSLKRRTLSTT